MNSYDNITKYVNMNDIEGMNADQIGLYLQCLYRMFASFSANLGTWS